MEVQHSSVPLPPAPAPEPSVPYSWREWHPNVPITYIRDHRRANHLLQRLNKGPYGLDLEWKPNYIKGRAQNRVALVQIANHEIIFLLQVSAMREFPSKLRDLLLDPNIIKVGVGIQDDATKLYRDWNVDLKNCVDLALLARTVDNGRWKGKYNSSLGLARLVAVYEYRALAKGKITRSNWEGLLTAPQQIYAANDAHAGYILYAKLMTMLPNVSPPPDASCYTFDTTDGALCVPFGKAPWRAFNPNYDPGPLPPPWKLKPPKQNEPNNQAMNNPGVGSSRTYTHKGSRGSAFRGVVSPPRNTS